MFERNPGLNAWGQYTCKCLKLKATGRLTDYFICEVEILDMKPLKDAATIAALPVMDKPNQPGTKAAIKVRMDQDWSGGVMIACLMGVTGDPASAFGGETPEEQEAGSAYIDELTDEERNPCFGLQFVVTVTKVPAKGEAGKPDPKLSFRSTYTHIGDPLKENEKHHAAWNAKIEADAAAKAVPAT